MINNIGIFINNTDSELKLQVNINNINKLKSNFHSIIIIDNENEFSEKLKYTIDEKIVYKFFFYNNFSEKKIDDFNYEKIKYVLDNLDNIDLNNNFYFTIIDDNYIYSDSLKNYFNYVNEHNLEFYSMTDSSEERYHYQLYLFSIKSNSVEKFRDYLKMNNKNLIYNLIQIFNSKMCYIKVAYIDINYENNIFFNSSLLYQALVEEGILPIINLNKLELIKKNFKKSIFNVIPANFNLEIYKSHNDLQNMTDEKLYNHFLNYGQYEPRIYSKDQFIYPIYIRNMLKNSNLLHFYDVPDDFNLKTYSTKYDDLKRKNSKELLIHWVSFGLKENRTYI
jgi:hypothetical protein